MNPFKADLIKNIQITQASINNYNFRYCLDLFSIQVNSTKTAILIMKNPSKTCIHATITNGSVQNIKNCTIDRTTSHVLNVLLLNSVNSIISGCQTLTYHFKSGQINQCVGYNHIIILNLYPLFSTNPKNLKIYNKPPKKSPIKNTLIINQNIIKSIINVNNQADIFLAWGGCPSGVSSYNSTIKPVLQLINKRKNVFSFDQQNKCFNDYSLQKITPYPIHGLCWR